MQLFQLPSNLVESIIQIQISYVNFNSFETPAMPHKELNSPEMFTNLPWVNVIIFELNGFNVFLWVPWSLSESGLLGMYHVIFQTGPRDGVGIPVLQYNNKNALSNFGQ